MKISPQFHYASFSLGLARCCSCFVSSNDESSDRKYGTFNQVHFLGEGRLGRVYKGILEDGQVKSCCEKAYEEYPARTCRFQAETQVRSRLEHSNVIKLIGYHDKGDVLFIVYELMPSQPPDLHLYEHEIGKKPLDWKTRTKIAEGVAKALEYLHDQKDPPLIYRDLKPSNILLDEKYNPKLSNFSIAKPGPTWNCRGASGKVMGTLGYGPPEYGMTGMLTREYDISIILARPFLDTKNFSQIADPVLGGCYLECGLAEAFTVAEMCIQEDATKRHPKAKIVTSFRYNLRN
ncbi:hypothetical protein MKX01_030398 [Papaver californicum]|nr:hypothetical protein MKX01_030398 [Papaver californicum]